jgi:hypothetical protein
MSSDWNAIPQAMQRHTGSNWSAPKAAKIEPVRINPPLVPEGPVEPEAAGRDDRDAAPESRAG